MFNNNNNIFQFNYEVQLDNVINAICDISFDIGKQIEEFITVKDKKNGFTIEDLFHEAFLKDMSVRPESLIDQTNDGVTIPGYTNDQFFSLIADYYNQNLFYMQTFLDGLDGSDILLINKKQSNLFGFGDKSNNRLTPALKHAKILKQLILQIKSDKIQGSLQKIDMFENDFLYRHAVSSSIQNFQPLLPSIPKSFLNDDLIDIFPIDKDDFWINFKCYKKIGIEINDSEDYFLVSDKKNNKELGLLINDTLLLYYNSELIKYINKDDVFEYYWMVFQNTYSHKLPNLISKVDESVEEFKLLNKDIELNQLLSYLKNNYYLNEAEAGLIGEKYSKFFNSVVFFDKLKFLEEYQFLMSSNIDEETALGIYSNEKKESSYNLLHWLSHKGASKVDHFRNSNPTERDKKLIYTLKPAICYYFLEKYFEDFFKSILINNDYVFFSNRSFIEKDRVLCEIDFFVKTQRKFYFFETKTKLSKFYIDEFLKKSSLMIDKFKPVFDCDIEIEFILLGGYSDNNVKEYQYFIDVSSKEESYNTVRENLNCYPYYFNVPIPDKKGKHIICIAEPQYDKLQELVRKICPK